MGQWSTLQLSDNGAVEYTSASENGTVGHSSASEVSGVNFSIKE